MDETKLTLAAWKNAEKCAIEDIHKAMIEVKSCYATLTLVRKNIKELGGVDKNFEERKKAIVKTNGSLKASAASMKEIKEALRPT